MSKDHHIGIQSLGKGSLRRPIGTIRSYQGPIGLVRVPGLFWVGSWGTLESMPGLTLVWADLGSFAKTWGFQESGAHSGETL